MKSYPNAPESAFAEVKGSYSEKVKGSYSESLEDVIQGLKLLPTKEFNKKFEEMMVSFFVIVYDVFICWKIFFILRLCLRTL